MSEESFIATYRSMIKWAWYKDITVHCLYNHLLRIVCMEATHIRGIDIPIGGILTSLTDLAQETGLTRMQVRTALEKLETSQDITITKCTSIGSLITLSKWFLFSQPLASITQDVTQKITQDVTQKISSEVIENNKHTEAKTHSVTQDVTQKITQDVTQDVLSKEQENKETSPTPLKENKEQEECLIKEKNPKKENETKYPFQAFWDLYDKKHDRPVCERLWEKMTEEEREACMAYVPKYVEATSGDRKQFRRYPATFLRNKSWKNDLPEMPVQKQMLMQFPTQPDVIPLPQNVNDVINKINELHLDINHEEAEKFFHHYNGVGWKKNGQPICNWIDYLYNWKSNIGTFNSQHGLQQQTTETQNEDSKPWWSKLPSGL